MVLSLSSTHMCSVVCREAEKVCEQRVSGNSNLSVFCSERPFDESLYPSGELLHDMDCITIVYSFKESPDNAALSMDAKKKKFRSTPSGMGRVIYKNLTSKSKDEVMEIVDTKWLEFEKDVASVENELMRLHQNKRFYSENERNELYELLLYGLFSTISSVRDLINDRKLPQDEDRRKREWNQVLKLFEEKMVLFYTEICSEVIILWLKLIIDAGVVVLESNVDWTLLSQTLQRRGVNGISLQLLQQEHWATLCENLSGNDQKMIFNATQRLLCKYPDTSMFRQKMQKEQSNTNLNVVAVGAGIVAVAAYMFSKFTM